ncbi:HCP-like protein [Stipitochalara longipes BDJ]|nr:HCP-like protein [Stipitochalara longipes BDJ]
MQNKPRLLDRALGIFVRNRTRALPTALIANQVSQQLESVPGAHPMELPQNSEPSNQISASSATPESGSQHPPVNSEAEDLVAKAIEYYEAGDLTKSTYHFRLAARQNHPTGMLIYALACKHGWGMRPNHREGITWLRKAADYASLEVSGDNDLTVDNLEQKTRRGQFAALMNGWGMEQDKMLALRCFEIAGSWGDGDALAEAGFCYHQGIGCKKDLQKSAKFYRQAEANGISMKGNSWIHKAKYNDDADDSKKASVLKQR